VHALQETVYHLMNENVKKRVRSCKALRLLQCFVRSLCSEIVARLKFRGVTAEH
jgi:hypothetical protein